MHISKKSRTFAKKLRNIRKIDSFESNYKLIFLTKKNERKSIMENLSAAKTTRGNLYQVSPLNIVVVDGFNSRQDFGNLTELAEQINIPLNEKTESVNFALRISGNSTIFQR